MLRYKTYQNKRKGNFEGQWYGRIVHEGTVDLDGLAKHMASHNTPFTEGQIKAILTDMCACVRELALESKKIKIPGLGTFFGAAKSRPADTEKEFTGNYFSGFRIKCFRDKGNYRSWNLGANVKLKAAEIDTAHTSGAGNGGYNP